MKNDYDRLLCEFMRYKIEQVKKVMELEEKNSELKAYIEILEKKAKNIS